MPQVIPIVVSAVATAAGASAMVVSLVTLAASAVVGAYTARQEKRKARDAYNAAQVDRLANVMTTVAPRELVLGRVRKGGAVYFRGSSGQFKETFVAHLALAAHEIDAVEQVYLNDQPVALDANGWVLTAPYYQARKESRLVRIAPGSTTAVFEAAPIEGTVTAAWIEFVPEQQNINHQVAFSVVGTNVVLTQTYPDEIVVICQLMVGTSYARVWWDLGGTDAPADSTTRAYFPELWGPDHRARGVAKLFALFSFNETAFPSSVPNISAVIRGAKLYDPRFGVSYWSENPALMARHVYTHPHFGKATPSADEDFRFMVAANACDITHGYVVSGVTESRTLYRASLVAPFGAAARDLLDDLTQAMAGMWALAGGQLYIRAGVYTAPVMTLTDADLAVVQRRGESQEQDALSVSVHRERAEKVNVVNARIWDEAQGYKQVALTPVKSTALIARDGVELAQEMTLAAVSYSPQAQHIAGVTMRDARDPLTIEAPFKLRAYALELFDCVELTLARYGWTAKTFIILGKSWDFERGVIRLTMKETAAAIYTPDAAFLPQGYAPNTALPKPWDIHPPVLTAAGIYSGTDELVRQADGGLLTRVRVTWPQVADLSVRQGGRIELQWTVFGRDAWQTVTADGEDTEAYIIGPADGQAILVRARSRNSLAVSDWSLQVLHQVQGLLEPPSAPATVALTPERVIFTPVADVDVAGYRILYNSGASTVRSVATPLHTGLVSGSPWPLPVRLYGVNTILVVAVDVAGNEGVAAFDTQDLGAPDAANVADEVDYAAAGFPGTITNGTVAGDDLLADGDADTDFYGAGSGSDIYYRDGAADIYGGDQFLALQYLFTYASPYSGGVILMDLTVEGPRPTVEFRIDGSAIGDIYSDDRPDFYDDVGVVPVWGTVSWGSPSWWIGGAGIYGTEPGWSTWTGALGPTIANVGYEFRITVDAGSAQGVITALSVRTEMPQIEQTFGNVSVSSGGTLLDPSTGLPLRRFISIEDVQITPIGNVAVGGRVKTYPIDPDTGPEIELLDSLASPVDGNAFVRVSGY